MECEAQGLDQTARNTRVKKYATMASVFALGVVLGMICLSAMESEGLNGSSVLKTIAPSKGHSKARYSAGCYGDSSLCAALLTARNGKEFQPLLRKSARAQGSRNVALQMSVGLYYSTTTGNTE